MILRPQISTALCGTLLAGMLLSAPAQAQNYPNRPITFVVPFAPGGLTDIPARVLAAVMQERIGASIVVENKTGGSGVIGASHVLAVGARRIHAPGQCARRRAEPALHPGALQCGDRLRDDRQDCRRAAAGPHHRRQAAVQVAGRAGRRRQGQSRTRSASEPRAPPARRSIALDATQCARRHENRGRALSRIRPGRSRRGDGRDPGYLHLLFQRQAAGGGRQGARACGVEHATHRELAGRPDHGRAGFSRLRSQRLRRPRRACQDAAADHRLPQQAPQRGAQLRLVQAADGAARHDDPDPTDNTPEKFAEFMRAQTARQAELAKLSGHAPMAPQR